MTGVAFACALAVVGVAFVVALWDALRRALASQVAMAQARVEATKREEVAELAAKLAQLRKDHDSLDHAVSVGRAVRR